jgi:NADH-quinone oxidoreductase subunit E
MIPENPEPMSRDLATTIKRWKSKPGNLIMILHEIQERQGYVPRDQAFQVARELNIPLARLWEVVTFYNIFKLSPPGDHVISVCMGTACYLKGADKLTEAFCERLGIQEGETTPDGKFHLQSVRCVGCCGLAPVAMVDGEIHGKLKPADIHRIIDDCVEADKEALNQEVA